MPLSYFEVKEELYNEKLYKLAIEGKDIVKDRTKRDE